MKELLVSEITSSRGDLFKVVTLLNQHIFIDRLSRESCLAVLIEECQQAIASTDDMLEKAELFLDCLYADLLFVDNKRPLWPVIGFELNSALDYRLIAPALKLILVQHIAKACGFDCDVVFIPEKLMVRITCDDEYAIIFDVVTGEAINWLELDRRMSELDNSYKEHVLTGESDKKLTLNYLTQLKGAFIRELDFENALKTIDLILALDPENPMQRRDRGFLLEQLDCYKLAFDDYRYFVEKCPQDPAAKLLQLQLERIDTGKTVIH
jgi:regulator of sirC expression with transglutaminase-like and TPR domain